MLDWITGILSGLAQLAGWVMGIVATVFISYLFFHVLANNLVIPYLPNSMAWYWVMLRLDYCLAVILDAYVGAWLVRIFRGG